MNAAAPVRWEELTWEGIASLLDQGIDMAILPVGATEQHGRHLPTGVDTISAVAVAEGASALTGIPVLAALPYGCSLGHTDKWPGTISLRPQTLTTLVAEVAEWVARSDFRRLLLLNGHVTNWAPMRSALENIRQDHPELKIALKSIWQLSPTIHDYYHDDGENWHANDAETSLMLHLRPELVDMEKAMDEPDRSADLFFSYTVDKESRHGAVGKPSRAKIEFGRKIEQECIKTLAEQLTAALDETGPDLSAE
jgi:creatinine amidohydrolase